jgi:hypothetical protein
MPAYVGSMSGPRSFIGMTPEKTIQTLLPWVDATTLANVVACTLDVAHFVKLIPSVANDSIRFDSIRFDLTNSIRASNRIGIFDLGVKSNRIGIESNFSSSDFEDRIESTDFDSISPLNRIDSVGIGFHGKKHQRFVITSL